MTYPSAPPPAPPPVPSSAPFVAPFGPPPPAPSGQSGKLIAFGVVALVWMVLLGVAVARSWSGGGGSEGSPQETQQFYPIGSAVPDPAFGTVGEPRSVLGGFAVTGGWVDAPRFKEGRVIVPHEDGLVAFDPAAAEQVWRNDACPFPSWASPFTGADAPAVVVGCDGDLVGVDVSDGSVLWRRTREPAVERVRTGPTTVVLQGIDRVTAIDLMTGQERGQWDGHGDANAVSNADTVFISNNTGVSAYDLASGTQRWFVAEPSSGLGATDEEVIARTNAHEVLRLDVDTGELVWAAEHEPVRLDWSEVIGFTDETVLVQATHGPSYLTAYDRQTGAKRWEFDPREDQAVAYGVGSQFVVVSDSTDDTAEARDAAAGNAIGGLPAPARGLAAGSSGTYVAVVTNEPELGLRVIALR